ncbi:MAG: Wzz/FepE/Etk N-terminal domain-containing protein [Planctomycetota bacterium]|nr:Wzz/FepE/Etk N-terminal domain-containing protein [Planctomycetota bacterium]
MAPQQQNQSGVPPQGPGQVGVEEIDLFDYLLVIWRHRWMIVLLSFTAMAATVGMMLLQPRRYQASATIVPPMQMLQKQSTMAGALGGLGSSMFRNILDTGSIASIYVEILTSREVYDTIVDQFDLMNAYENIENRTKARRRLASNTSIKTTTEGVVKVAVTDRDPNRAAAMANAYIAELDRQNKRISTGEATSKRIFLESRLKEVEARLSRIDSTPAHEAQIQEMLYELLVRETELAKIEEAKSMPTLQVLDDAVVPELPVARGTVTKGVLAGTVAFVFGIFLAFLREYVAAVKDRNAATIHVTQPETNVHCVASQGEGVPNRGRSKGRRPVAEVGSNA